MSKRTAHIPWFAAPKTAGTLLLVAAVAILLQIATGVDDYPPVPPGALILGGVGLILLFVPWRWTIVLGVLVSAFISFGGLQADPYMQRLALNGGFGPVFSSWLQAVALLAALVVSVIGLVYAIITPKTTKASPA